MPSDTDNIFNHAPLRMLQRPRCFNQFTARSLKIYSSRRGMMASGAQSSLADALAHGLLTFADQH